MIKLPKLFLKDQNTNSADLNSKNGFWHKNKYIILSFIIPFVIISLAYGFYNITPFGFIRSLVKFAVYGIGQLIPQLEITVKPDMDYLFGDKQILVIDAWHQYYPFLYDLHEKLQSGGSLLWSWSTGLGADFIALSSYYLFSPLNFLSVFVPDGALVSYLAFITAVKIALCGMFTAICFRIIFKKNDYTLLIFSVLFALCSFNMGYYWCVMWLDSVAMLPLAVAGTVSLLRDGKYKLFTISLALAVIFNYYIGFFICIAVLLTAIGYTVTHWQSWKHTFISVLKTAVCSVIALIMTAFITVPAFLALQNCYKSSAGFPTEFKINHGEATLTGLLGAFSDILSNMLSFVTPTSLEGLPNIACGILCIVLLGVFFFSKKIKLSEKLFSAATLVFLIASFVFVQLDYVMHAFHFPNMLPHRYSFIFCFMMIYIGFRAFSVMGDGKLYHILFGGIAFAVLAVMYALREKSDFSMFSLCASLGVAVVLIGLLLLFKFGVMPKRVIATLLCLVVIGEAGLTALIGVKGVGNTPVKDYPESKNDISAVLEYANNASENEFYRIEKTQRQTCNDGALLQYNAFSTFSSMLNANTTGYAIYLGATGNRADNSFSYFESSPVTNLIFNLKYLIDVNDTLRIPDYLTAVAKSDTVTLYENNAYVPTGFMADTSLLEFDSVPKSKNEGSVGVVFENQIDWFRAATGIETPVYNKIPLESTSCSSEFITSKELEPEIYSLKIKTEDENQNNPYWQYDYTVNTDGLIYISMRTNASFEKAVATVNGKEDDSIKVENGSVHSVGSLKSGDKVSVRISFKKEGARNIKAYCYALNKEVFDEGVEILRRNTLKTTEITDTSIKGRVTADKDGLLYISIPYQNGWRAKVDGKDAEIKLVGGSMCALELAEGEHTVELYYVPINFIIGVCVSLLGIAMFACLILILSKKNFFEKTAVSSCETE